MSPFAKQALLAKHAYVAALLAGAAAVASAQTGTPPAAGPAPTAVHESSSGMVHPGRGGHDPARLQAIIAKRLAELKTKLQLTPDQESSWATFSTAMTPPAAMGKRMQGADRGELDKLSTPERIDKMRAMREQRHAAMSAEISKREEATKVFYATLSTDQKKTFDAETHRMMRSMHNRMQGHHGS